MAEQDPVKIKVVGSSPTRGALRQFGRLTVNKLSAGHGVGVFVSRGG
jgi:hypothetical protein